MKKLLLITALIAVTLGLKAQVYIALEDTSSVYAKVDADPQFPGGFRMFDRYIDDSSVKVLKPKHATGVIIAGFFVEKTGKITNPKIIRGLTPETDSAAVKLLKNSPLWKAGLKNGVPVKTFVKAAIKFIYSGNLRPVHVPEVVLSNGHNADVTIDEPVGTVESPKQPFDPNKIYTSVEKVPEFPGGNEALYKYLKDNNSLKGTDKNINGRVILSFVVEIDGSLTNIKVVRSFSTDCGAEALRMLKLSPKWHPGIAGGKSVRVAYMIPVQFGGN